MKIKLIFHQVMHEFLPRSYPENTEFIVEIDSNTTVQQLLDQAGETNADLSKI